MKLISVIVTTYNWAVALRLCLLSLYAQTDKNFEILIADDGSTPDNLALTQSYTINSPVPVHYVYHEDQGFRAGTIRNRAVAQSHGDYLLFIDGDCIARPDFIATHRALAEAGYFVAGNRVLLNQAYTQQVMRESILLHEKSACYFLKQRLQGNINRTLPFLKLPLGFLRKIQPQKWQKAMTCNLAIWREDFLQVNGFDELFEGWGYEDSDLVIRLIHAGVRRKEGRFAAPVLHCWHRFHDRSQHDANYHRLMERLADKAFIVAEKGISQSLNPSFTHTKLIHEKRIEC
jgi:glycosyltransferase involved in cell wall biosynthesis